MKNVHYKYEYVHIYIQVDRCVCVCVGFIMNKLYCGYNNCTGLYDETNHFEYLS